MKRSALIVIALLVVLYPGAAWFLGSTIENRLGETMQQFSAKTPYVRVIDSHFHRGWFVSEQDVTVEAFGDTGAAPGVAASMVFSPLRLAVHNVIHHGPICGFICFGVAQIDTHLVWGDQIQTYLTPIFGSSEPLTIKSQFGFFGGGSGSVSSPAIQDAVLGSGSHLSSQGFDLHSTYRADYDAYSFRGSLPHLLFRSSDNKQVEISSLVVDAHSTRALRSLYTGDSSVTVGILTVEGVSPTGPVSLKDLRSASTSSLTDGYMSMTYKLGVASVVTAPLTLTGVHFDFTLQHLEAESLAQFISASQAPDQASILSPAERVAKMTAAFKAPATSLFSHQPEIIVDRISVATAAGSAFLSGAIKTHGIVAEDFSENADPNALLRKVDADMQFTADDALLTSLPGGANAIAQLQPLVVQGLISHEANKFHTTIGFHQGQTTFNGKPFGIGGPAVK